MRTLLIIILFVFLLPVKISFAQRDLETITKPEELKQYIHVNAPSEDAFVAVQRLAAPFIDANDWDAAIKVFDNYRMSFPLMGDRFDKITDMLKAPSQNLEITNLESINTDAGEYFPVITIDSKRIYFTGSDRSGGVGGEDIFYSDFTDGSWQTPKLLGAPFSTKEDDAINSISADGNTLILFGNYKGAIGGGDNFYAEKTATGWTAIKPFPKPINSAYWDCDGFLSADGNAFFFTSDRRGGIGEFHKGGVFFHGGYEGNTDIYVSLKNDSSWSKPINLGSKINTPYSERSPFLHPDGKTLYFSSDGHYGLGSLDVFKSIRLSDTSWTEWSEPVNLGKDINTTGFDVAYKISTDGKYAYFSSDRAGGKGGYDIYSIKLPEEAKPDKNVITISGKVTDESLNPIDASMKWYNLETNSLAGSLTSNPETGEYIIVLPVGARFSYFAEKPGYYSVSKEMNLSDENTFKEITEDIMLVSVKSLRENSIKLNNIYFDFDKYELKPDSYVELGRVVKFLADNPSINIEISAYTDSKGSDDYNLALSQKRAQSVVDHLIAKGIIASRLIAKGYGKANPVASNETEEGRAQNRRVEMKIL